VKVTSVSTQATVCEMCLHLQLQIAPPKCAEVNHKSQQKIFIF